MEEHMPRQVAYCGIFCDECPTYLATQADDDELRKKVASEWTKAFGFTLEAESINCDGCLASEGARLFGHCQNCAARICGLDRGVKNCGACDDYQSCDKIKKIHEQFTFGKSALDMIYASRSK